MNGLWHQLKKENIASYYFLLLFSAYSLVAMEWMFFATKPSFISSLTNQQMFEALFIVSLEWFVVGTLAFILIAIILILVNLIRQKNIYTLLLIPTAMLFSFTVLLLIDNFSNTVIGYGISKSEGIGRACYIPAFIFIYYRIFQKLYAIHQSSLLKNQSALMLTASSMLIFLSAIFSVSGIMASHQDEETRGMTIEPFNTDQESRRPNIIFFASDGFRASLLSTYGNKHITTPNLDQFKNNSLIAGNAFTNSERTTGSITSMLTGKYPATNKVLFPPHVLQGNDAYQHLPGILKRLGYSTFQESVRYYADANDLNYIDSFDFANGIHNENLLKPSFTQVQHARLFSRKIVERISQRVKHILYIEKMPDVYAAVKPEEGVAKVYGLSDRTRIDRAIDFIKQSDDPFFMHIHLMDSHCCTYKPKTRIFSNKTFKKKHQLNTALLEDLVKESDDYLGEIVDTLRDVKELDNTIIVYSSDHTNNWGFRRSIPMVFVFPDKEYAGTIEENTQLLDVAPTILNYLNIKIPDWMEGRSLLSETLDPYQPIFGITKLERGHFNTENKDRLSHIVGDGPPNYGLNIMGMIVCNRWYLHNIRTGTNKSGKVRGHEGNCKRAKIPSPKKAQIMMIDHLTSKGFGEYNVGMSGIQPGAKIPFNDKNVIYEGWSKAERRHRWSLGKDSGIIFKLDDRDLFHGKLVMGVRSLGKQSVVAYLNGVQIGQLEIDSRDSQVSLDFDPGVLQQKTANTLKLTFSDPHAPNTKDKRALALSLRWLQFE